MTRELSYAGAVLEATIQCMEEDSSVYIMGLGVPDPRGIFGTTLGLRDRFGDGRVMDMPVSENAMTGIAIGSAIVGLRPIMTHQRIDFMLLSFDQLINNAAKWHYMFGGRMKVPLVIRLLIGRGWGQGPQHSQCLQAMFAHVPGLKVVMPTTPYDAKGLLISAVRDENPVIYIEHRWLHNVFGPVPEEAYQEPIGKARIVREGTDATIVSSSYMTLEAIKAADILHKDHIVVEIVDLRSIKPLDESTILASVRKTGRLIVADHAWKTAGFSSEVITLVAEQDFSALRCAPVRITLPDMPTPTSHALARDYYPRAIHIVNAVRRTLGLEEKTEESVGLHQDIPLDVPDQSFKGPF